MKKKLIREHIPLHTEAWHKYRMDYVNASECGALMGLSQYSCAAKLFNEKIGVMDPWKDGNRYTHFGLKIEDIIAEAWEHYDPAGEEDNYVQNYKNGIVIRKCKNVKDYIRNPKYNWLSMSLDRVINKGMPKMNGEILKEEVPLELKSIQSYEINRWETVPPAYLAQIHVQMIISETDYSELCLLESSNKLHLYPIEYNADFGNQILDLTHDFHQKVVEAKKLLKSIENETDESKRADVQYLIDQLEPNTGMESKAYEDFLKEKYREGYVKKEAEGSMEDWECAVKYLKANEKLKEVEDEKQLYKNKLIKSLGVNEFLSFGEDGQISYSPNKNNVRTLRVKINN